MAYPTDLDDLGSTNPTADDNLGSGPHHTLHSNERDAIDALEEKVGISSSEDTDSLDYKLSGITGSDIAASLAGAETLTNKTLTTPVISALYKDVAKTKQMTFPDVSSDTVAVLTATQTLTNKTLTAPIISAPVFRNHGGWIDANETWAYASATTITVPSGAASKYGVGDKIRFQNNDSGTYLYAWIITVADTLLTVTGDAVPNATLTDNYYSHEFNPIGFDLNPQNIGAKVYLGGDMDNLTDTTATKVLLGTEVYDLGNNFASYKFTAPVSGYYMVNGAIQYQSPIADKRYYCYIYKDGESYALNSSGNGGDTSFHSVACSSMVYLAATNYVELYAYVATGAATVDINSGYGTYMDIQFLHI